jgi:hypothetical protein
MKKVILFVAALLAIVPMASVIAEARGGYLTSVNDTCPPPDYSCSLCHPNGDTNRLTNTGVAYSANYDACVICPDVCGGGGGNCTDSDNDGYFAEPGCGQLYDCNDDPTTGGFRIYPGAPEIACDGIDQDCSGADKTKGRGCRKR